MHLPRHAARAALALALAASPLLAAPTPALAEGEVFATAQNTGISLQLQASSDIDTSDHAFNFEFEGLNYNGATSDHGTTAAEAGTNKVGATPTGAAAHFATQITANATARNYYLKFLPDDPTGSFPHAGVYRYRVTQKAGDRTDVTYNTQATKAYIVYVSVKNAIDTDSGNYLTEPDPTSDADPKPEIPKLEYGPITAATEPGYNPSSPNVDPSDPPATPDDDDPQKVDPSVPTSEVVEDSATPTPGRIQAMSSDSGDGEGDGEGEGEGGGGSATSTPAQGAYAMASGTDDGITGRIFFSNKYAIQTGKLTISMAAKGSYADLSKTFALTTSFKVPYYVTLDDLTDSTTDTNSIIKVGETTLPIAKVSLDDTTKVLTLTLTDTDAVDALTLHHGQSVDIAGLPVDTLCTINDPATPNYRPQAIFTYKATEGGAGTETKFGGDNTFGGTEAKAFGDALEVLKATPGTGETIANTTSVGKGGSTVAFTNVADDDALDPNPTGLIQRNLPYVLVIGGAAAGIAILALLGHRRDEDAE